jgi:ADP-dependent NAD(P)H-hydrate dehydratase
VTRKPRPITPALLRKWPLPFPAGDDDKNARGRLLAVAGSAELPGAAVLAANAALRAGAGKVCIATDPSVAVSVGIAVPEARIVAADRRGCAALLEETDRFDALLVGPGIFEPKRGQLACMRELAAGMSPVVVDAGALDMFANGRRAGRGSQFIVTPHMGEMAHLAKRDKDFVEAHAPEIALRFAAAHGAIVVLKGSATFVADPDGALWAHDKSNVALAVSGSGDVLAGIIAALAARGASCAQAAVWGVALHAQAGRRLVSQHGKLGGLARELPAFIPAALRDLGSR